MKLNDLKREGNLVTFQLEEDYQELEGFVKLKYKQEVKKTKIPGFRQGKAPLGIFIQHYGKERLDFDALIELLNAKYPLVVKENNIEAIDQPKDLDIIQMEEGQPIKVSLSVEVKPEVKISKYKGIKLEKDAVKVAATDVQVEIDALAEKFAEYDFDEKAAIKEGDLVTSNTVAKLDGEDFSPWTKENDVFKAGNSAVGTKFDDEIYGLKQDEEKTFSIAFEEDSPNKEIAGKSIEFTVKINKVKAKNLPKVTDEFIADKTESMSLDDFKKETEEKLRANIELASENKLKDDASKWVIESVQTDVPNVMVEREVEFLLRRMENSLRMYNMGLDQYLQMMQKTIDDLKEEYKTEAENTVKLRLGLEEISKQESIEASEDDIKEEIDDAVKNQEDEEMKKNMRMQMEAMKEDISASVVNKKVIDFLLENAKIKQKK